MKKGTLLLFLLLVNLHLGYSQTPVTATISYQGYDETQAFFGEAEYEIFMDNTTNVFDKPIIVVDGFDPNDTRDIAGMYAGLDYNGNNIADQLRSEGFDFVFLNFPVYTRATDNVVVDGGSDYIQRNAMVLIETINQINAQKTGSEELVIVGPSMGGLIARYALKYMEDNSLAHQTRLYVSWDSPHNGANIPISLQYLMNYLAEANGGNANLQAAVAATLDSPASKEMLLDHYTTHLQNGSSFAQDPALLLPEGTLNFRNAFQAELDVMGFPQQTRNIAIANGSSNGAMTGMPGMEILNDTFVIPNSAGSTIEIILHFTPAANQTIEVKKTTIDVPVFADIIDIASATSFPYTDGVDSAPGGMYDIQSFIGGAQGNQLLTDLLNALQQSQFCFIPTISSLAITNEDNWFAATDMGNTHTSAFDAWYIPTANEDHVTATAANVAFVLPEIRNQVAGILDENYANKYQLKSNPVVDKIEIVTNSSFQYNNANVVIYAISGQKIKQELITDIDSEFMLPIQLEKGIYFLEITDNQTVFVRKFIVN